ncbi:MAG: hypothetical protein AMK69_07625 [Nitrospira bacterium SG8_3]|nr:MAG: hypothetical protein AMK69_07625 [Nitrospira bacterium SG8_3]
MLARPDLSKRCQRLSKESTGKADGFVVDESSTVCLPIRGDPDIETRCKMKGLGLQPLFPKGGHYVRPYQGQRSHLPPLLRGIKVDFDERASC